MGIKGYENWRPHCNIKGGGEGGGGRVTGYWSQKGGAPVSGQKNFLFRFIYKTMWA